MKYKQLIYAIVTIVVLATVIAGLNNETYKHTDYSIIIEQDYVGSGLHQSLNYNVTNINVTAQKFTLTQETEIRRIGVRINKCNVNLYDVTVQIKKDLNKPLDYELEYSIPNSELQSSAEDGIWNYKDVNITLPAGTYYLAVGSDPSGKNPHCWIYYDTGNYTGGELWYELSQVNSGKADAIFRLYTAEDIEYNWNETWLNITIVTILGLVILSAVLIKIGVI